MIDSDERLLTRFAATRDQAIREELTTRFLPLVASLAGRYRDRGERMEDLEQVARLGLLKAIDGFDDTRANGFGAYATPTILGELRRHFRDRVWNLHLPRGLQERSMEVNDAIERLSDEHGHGRCGCRAT